VRIKLYVYRETILGSIVLYYDTIIIIIKGDFVWFVVPLLPKHWRNLDFVLLFMLD